MKPTLPLLTVLLLAPLAALHAADTGSTLFYQPSLLADRSQRFSAWSHSIAVRDGRMFNAVSVQRFGPDGRQAGPLGVAIAESDDGVHWRETDALACPLAHGLAGYCVRWTGEEFVYFSSERNQGADRKDYPVVLRQHRSRDLKNWERTTNQEPLHHNAITLLLSPNRSVSTPMRWAMRRSRLLMWASVFAGRLQSW